MMIIGLVLFLFAPVFIDIFVPNNIFFSKPINSYVVNFVYCISVIILTLALAKKRIENARDYSLTLVRVLTPAQISLIASMILLMIGDVVPGQIGKFIYRVGAVGILVSIVLAIVRAALEERKQDQRKKSIQTTKRSQNNDTVTTASPVGQAVPKEHCEKCEDVFERGTLRSLNGHKYCISCYKALMDEQAKAREAAVRARCCVCGIYSPTADLIIVDDQYICESCFAARYPGAAAGEDDTDDLLSGII